jgi:threonine dehydrogenase-like Zn-dependent dehydrogenase
VKLAILPRPMELVIEDQPLDTENLGPRDVYVETELTAFKLGTDRGNYEGEPGIPGAGNSFPRTVGDSTVGIVRGVGSGVTRFSVGDRVVSQTGHRSAHVTREDDYGATGNLVKVPEGVHPEDAVYAVLYSLSGYCYTKARFRPGEYVAVVGTGVLGIAAVAVGPIYGAQVAAIANSPVRLEMAKKMGAHAGFLSDDPDLQAKLDEFTLGNGVDLVILTANPWPAYKTACEIVRRSGRISVVALSGRGEADLDFNPLWSGYFYDKGISLIAASGVTEDTYPSESDQRWSSERRGEHILGLMEDGRLQPSKLITHRMHYTEIAKAYEMMETRDKNMLGVVFDWTDVEG